MGELADWAKGTEQFFTISDGETFEGVYQDYFRTRCSHDPTKKTVCYKFDNKFWFCKSKEFAEEMDLIPKNTKLRIKREGKAYNTKYYIEVIE